MKAISKPRIVRILLKFRRILQDSWSQSRNFGEFLEDFERIPSFLSISAILLNEIFVLPERMRLTY